MYIVTFWTCIVAINLHYCNSKDLPSFIKKCKKDDSGLNQCLKERIEELKPYLIKGLPELKLPAIEPLHLPQLKVSTGNGNGIGFNATFSNIEVYGVKDFKLVDIFMDFQKKMFFADVYFPQFRAFGQYNFNGKILMLALDGAGDAQINITNVHAFGNRTFTFKKNNGMQYITLQKVTDAYIEYEGLSMHFDNLFKNNEQLTNDVNRIVNDNYKEIGKEVNPFIYNALLMFFNGVMQNVFDEFSLEELFE